MKLLFTYTLLLAFCMIVTSQLVQTDYAVILEATESSTVARFFQWTHQTDPKVIPVIDFYRDNTTGIPITTTINGGIQTAFLAGTLNAYLNATNFAVKVLLPTGRSATTAIFWRGTASLRNLTDSYVTNLTAAIRNQLTNSPFLASYSTVKFLSWNEEHMYSWVAANYLEKTLGLTLTYGFVDVNEKSASVSFSVPTTPLMDSYNIIATQYVYNLYTHSYDDYGTINIYSQYVKYLIAANPTLSVIENPCGFRDYSELQGSVILKGTSQAANCTALLLQQFFPNATCTTAPCSFNGIYQPYLSGTSFYTSKTLASLAQLIMPNHLSGASVSDLVAATSTLCSLNWNATMATYPNTTSLSNLCFTANYYAAFLSSLGLPSNGIYFISAANNVSFSWGYGSAVYEISAFAPYAPYYNATAGITTGITWPTAGRIADFAGNFLGVFFGVVVLILFVGVVTLGCHNDYLRSKGQLAP